MDQYNVFVHASLPTLRVKADDGITAVYIARHFISNLDLPLGEMLAVNVTGDDWEACTYLAVEPRLITGPF